MTAIAPPTKPRRWPRRIRRILIGIIVAAFLFRVILFFALRPVLRRVGNAYGVNVNFGRQELTLLGGNVGLWNFTITSKVDSQPILQADYIAGNISTFALLSGKLHVLRAEADGVDLNVVRNKDGTVPIVQQLLLAKPNSKETTATDQPFDFTPPLMIEALRLEHVRAAIRDEAIAPPVHATVAMDIRVSNFGASGRPTHFDMDVWSDPMLDLMRVSGEGSSSGRNLDASLTVFMRGLHPKPLAGYLEPHGIHPIGTSVGMDLHATLKAEPATQPSNGVKAQLLVDHVDVTADGQPALALKTLRVDADDINPSAAKVATVQIEGGRLNATRGTTGLLQLAGVELTGTSSPSAHVATTQPAATTNPSPFKFSVQELALRDMIATLQDLSVTPTNELKFDLSEIVSKGRDLDPNNPQTVVPITGSMNMPGIVKNIELHGSATPFAPDKKVDLTFAANGIKLDALRPYLAAIGVESLLNNAQFHGQLTGTLHDDGSADAHVTSLHFADGPDLLGLGQIDIQGAGLDAQTGRLKLDAMNVTGPNLNVMRDAHGRVTLAGFRWTPTSQPAVQPVSTKAPPSTQPFELASLPRVQIGRFTWKNVRAKFHDEQIQPPSDVSIDDAGIEAKDIVFDLVSNPQPQTGTFHVWLNSPQLAKQFDINGTLASSAGKLQAQINLTGQGLHTAVLGPYLQPLGVTPTLQDGSASLDAQVNLSGNDEQTSASFSLTKAQLSDGGAELGGVDSLTIDDVTTKSNELAVKSVHIVRPRAQIAREKDDSFSGLGVNFKLPPQPETPTTQPATQSPLVATLGQLNIDDGQIGWTDNAFVDPVKTTGHASVQLSNVTLGKSAQPATLQTQLKADGMLDSMTINGTVNTSPDAPSLHATIDGKGIRAGAAAAYLPPGIALSTSDGRLKAVVNAGISKNDQGGIAAHLQLQNIDWRDGEDSPLASFDAMQITAPRIDLDGNVIAVDEISLSGLQVAAQRDANGSLHVAGLTLGSTQTFARADVPTTQPIVSDVSPQDVARLVSQSRRPLPLMTLGKLDLNLKSFALNDPAHHGAAPLIVQDVELKNREPLEMGGPRANDRKPVLLDLTGKISPIVGSFTVNTSATPLANEPNAVVDVAASGIRGDGVTDLLPELKPLLDGSKLTNGQFKTQLQAHLKFDRKGPRDFDLSRGFQVGALVNGIQFQDDDKQLLAGLDSIAADDIRVQPKNSTVLIKSIDIAKPALRAYRDDAGVHAMGFILRIPQTQPAATQPTDQSQPTTTTVATTQAAPPAGEIRIDRLTVNGLDARIEDRSVNPQLVVPLNNLDMEVHGLTTRALTESRPIRFSALVNADKVSLPVKVQGSGIAGAIGDIAALASGKNNAPTTQQMEDRALLSQVAIAGRVVLYPKPNGFVKTSVNGMELAALQGEAAKFGVDLHGGVFDGDVDLHFKDNGDLDTRTKLVATDLQLAEPPNGPIVRDLALPAPLDAVIKVLQDADGSITVPLSFTVANGNLSGSTITGAAIGAFGSIVTTALANAPIKLAQSATGLIGLGGNQKVVPLEPVVIEFTPGSTYLETDAREKLSKLIEMAKDNGNLILTVRHELGGEDVALASQRANPAREDSLALAKQLRDRKFVLAAQRFQLAGQVRAQVASDLPSQSDAIVAQLRDLDTQSAQIDESLDQLYDLLRPGADRQADRRTRAACLQIGQQRMDAINQVLQAANLPEKTPDGTKRINLTNVQFNPPQSDQPGRIVIALIGRKKSFNLFALPWSNLGGHKAEPAQKNPGST